MDATSHYDLLVVLTVLGVVQIGLVLLTGAAISRRLARLERDVLECQRLARGVAGLVAQETSNLREALRRRE